MKQHTYLLLFLLLTVSVGRSYSYGHGVKGSINKSYSSSSASASSSAFSSSYSSGLQGSDGSNNAIKPSSGAFSSAFAGSGTDGASAKAGSGAFAGAGSGAFSGSGSFSGTGSNSQSGSYSGSGSISGSGASQGLGQYSGENKAYGGEAGHIPVVAGGSGATSGSGSYISGSGSHNLGPVVAGGSGGATSGSGSYISGQGPHNIIPGDIPVEAGDSGTTSGPGSYISGSGSHNLGPGHIPVVAGGSGAASGSGSYISGTGPHNLGPGLVPASGNPQISGTPCGENVGCSISGNQPYSGSGIIVGIGAPGQDSDKILPANGANSHAGTNSNNIRLNLNTNPNNAYVNDFQIPEEYSPKTQYPEAPKHQFPGPQGSIYDSKPASQGGGAPDIQKTPEQHTYSQSGSIGNAYAASNADSFKPGSCKSCKGPFPGPKGNIHDYKPAPQGGPPAWVPEQQTQPPLVRPPIDVSKFPGSPGSIYDSKPVSPGGGKIPVGVIPVVIGGPQYNQRPQNQPSYNQVPHNQPTNQSFYNQPSYNQNKPTYHQVVPQPKPGAIAVSVIGKLPGPTGNIHNSVEVIKPGIQIPVSIIPGTYDQKPLPSPDNFDKPGNNNKPVSGHGCINGQCLNQPDFKPQPNNKPGYPDCTHGECDEFGGRLGCHGDDCFGPGKKPSYVHSGSDDKTQSNNNAQHQNGNVNVDFNHPTPGNYKPDCSRGQCNINGAYHPEKPLPGSQGKTCSGIECLNHAGPQVNIPVVVVPESIKPHKVDHEDNPEHPKLDFDIDLRQKPDNYYNPIHKEPSHNGQHSSANSNSNAHSSNNQENINVQIDQQPDRIPNDILPTAQYHPQESSTPKPNLHEDKPGESRDFLLPGNKPYHRHPVKQHRPSHEKDRPSHDKDKDRPKKSHDDQPNPNQENHPEGGHPQPLPGSTYYKCTGESCELPKPDVSREEQPGKTYYSCSGSSCPLPHPNRPEPSTPGCQGNQCGAGGKDRIFPSPFVPPTGNNGPSVSPVLIGVPPQENQGQPRPGNQYSGSGSVANAGANSFKETGDDILPGTGHLPLDQSLNKPYNQNNGCSSRTCQLLPGLNSQGFVSGNVIVQKPDGQQVPVIDVHIPNNQPGQPCSGSKCSFQNQHGNGEQYTGGNAGSYSGYSGVQPCTKGNCRTSSQPGNGGAYSGGFSGSKSGNSEGPCGNGNCGHGINAVNFGGHSGAQSGSFSGATSFGGVKGGPRTPINGGSYSGSGASGSGAFSGSSAGSFASANSGNGPDANFKALKDILSESLKYSGFEGGVPGAFGAGSFAQSGASSHGPSSAYSGAFSSAGSY